jgi:prepilin-type N-terminal cleavage/methylation domain-containing protein
MMNLRLIRNQRGFTLVELLAVIVILGIVFSLAVISLGGTKEKAEADVCAANLVELESSIGVVWLWRIWIIVMLCLMNS